ncbi:hypothetical protein F5I97DRAFT_1849003 [Phlebopus sp. FC_14]|nr:hypothetical protein F5I97DRAFT_1849003 [Phlebopus sp. FC_14]
MLSNSVESLVEERVAQLEAIAQRRHELLRQMYHMIRQRQNAGAIFALDQNEGNELQHFLDRFDIEKNPESGSISSLAENELYIPSSPPSDAKEEAEEHDAINIDSPMSEPPASPRSKSSIENKEREPVETPSVVESPPRSTPSRKRPRENEDEDGKREGEGEGTVHALDDTHHSPSSRAKSIRRSRSASQRSSPIRSYSVKLQSPEPMSVDQEGSHEALEMVTEEPAQDARGESPDLMLPSSSPMLKQKETSPPRLMVIHTAVDVASLQPSLLIPTPTSPALASPEFSFDDGDLDHVEEAPQPTLVSDIHRHPLNPAYTLPPLKSLPPDYLRKGKSSKQRKRDKEKGESRSKDEWMPMGFAKWGALLRANPIHRKVSRATKCLSTRDWSVAISELRLLRTLERVESLENVAKWSYRQPKKQRNLGGMTKTHWDYLMDEMKWMRVDFREERKWKYVLAFNLSTAVLEWHEAGSREQRMKQGICKHWRRPRSSAQQVDNSSPRDMDVDVRGENGYTPMAEESDNEEEEAEPEQHDIVDSLDTRNALEEALEGSGSNSNGSAQSSQRQSPGPESVRPKVEDVEDPLALQNDNNTSGDAMDIDVDNENPHAKEETADLAGLKPHSTDPVLASNTTSDTTRVVGYSKHLSKSNLYSPLRERIAYSDDRKLFIDHDDLDLVKALSDLTTEDKTSLDPIPPPPDLSDIFPDLQPLGIPDVTPSGSGFEGRKKSEKKSEENKRVDDSGYTKMAPMGKFILCKPTLLGPLQPVKRWKNGRWLNAEEPAVTEAEASSSKISDDYLSELFDGLKPQGMGSLPPLPPKDGKRRLEHAWSPSEDAVLKSLVEKYPSNWTLVADLFNSARITISIDKRTSWECFERWNVKFGGGGNRSSILNPDISSSNADATPPPTPSSASSAQAQMTTRGVKRLANITVAQHQNHGSGAGLSSDIMKRRRHTLMYETIRKVAKRREAAQKTSSINQRKASNVHDTHGQYNKMPKLTPAELSRMKAEKEQQEMLLARRRHEELARQQLMRDPRMQAAAQVQPQVAVVAAHQQQQQQQQQSSGTPRPPAQPPAPQVPAIRGQPVQQVNISQQQRIPTPMTSAAAAARMSPQQLLQAQAAQARAIAAAAQTQAQVHAQLQAQGISGNVNAGTTQANVNVGGIPAGAHLSPPYHSRAATSSPSVASQASPPRNALTPQLPNVASPQPSQAQPQLPMQNLQIPGNGIARQPGSIPAHYFPVVSTGGTHFTQEQVDQAMRLSSLIQHRTSLAQAQQNSQYQSQN